MNLPQWNSPDTLAGAAGAGAAADAAAAPRPDALLPGTRLEEFEIERVLASSGFGIVYLAVEAKGERRVVIKEYLPLSLVNRASDGTRVELRAIDHAEAFERGRRAFIEEALLLARLDHPSLVKVLGSWHANGTAYRAMPHYPGHTLLSLRQAMDEPPDEPSLRALLDGVLGALEMLHAAGMVHGAIAPDNILLMPDDHPVLLDGGAARRAIVAENTRALMMTLLEPSFAPPEQTAPSPERPIGPWTDLYSLAAVMHYSVSGKLPPVATETASQAAHAPLAGVVQAARGRFPFLHVSRQFAATIDAALAPDPARRPQDVAGFRALLDSEPPTELPVDDTLAREASNDPEIGPPSVSAGLEPEAPEPVVHDLDRIAEGWRRQRRRNAWAPWAAAAGLVLLGGAVAWTMLWPGPGPEVLARRAPAVVATVPVAPVETAPAPVVATAAPVVAATSTPPPPTATNPDTASTEAAAIAKAAPLPELPDAPTAAIKPPIVAAAVASPPPSPRPPAAKPPAATKARATPVASTQSRPQAARTPASPREVCGGRTQFSLYRCMQTQCAQSAWSQHAQCKLLRTRDIVE